MRIRSVKPEWLDDERLVLASANARVMSIALILLADDEGRGRANHVMLGARVFPGSTNPREDSTSALRELASMKFVVLYEAEGQTYYTIRNWKKHQRIDRPTPSNIPEPPPESEEISQCSHPRGLFDEDSTSPRGVLAPDRNGKDRKGKESGEPSRADLALADPRVVRVMDVYRTVHQLSDRWNPAAKEDGVPRCVRILDALDGGKGDRLTEDEIIAAIHGNKADEFCSRVGKHEIEYVLRPKNVHGFISKGQRGRPKPPPSDPTTEALNRIQAEIDTANRAGDFQRASELREQGYALSRGGAA